MNPWIEALRLRSLPMSLAGALVASGLAAGASAFRWEVFVLLATTVLALQVLANFADEYGDLQKGADTDERVGPKRGMQRGEISFRQMRTALIGMTVLSFALGATLVLVALGLDPVRILIFLALGVFALFAAIGYTVGKRAYGYYGLADLFCLVCFGLLVVCAGYYLYAHTVTVVALLAGFGIGLLVCGMLNLNNMRDRETDAKTGKNTLVVRLGASAARVYHLLLVVLGMLCLGGAGLVLAWGGDVTVIAGLNSDMMAPAAWGSAATTPAAWGSNTDGAGIGSAAMAPAAWGWWRFTYLLAFIPLILHLRAVRRVETPAAYDALMRPYSLCVIVVSVLFALCVGV
jgi:1,4-dihydroxy-2-naphthoate octaprenyltransferase